MLLTDIKIGEKVKIIRINNDKRTADRLNDIGVIEGVTVELIAFAPFGNPMLIKVRDFKLAIRLEDAKKIVVEKL